MPLFIEEFMRYVNGLMSKKMSLMSFKTIAGTSSYFRLLLFKSRIVSVTSVSVIFEMKMLLQTTLTTYNKLEKVFRRLTFAC